MKASDADRAQVAEQLRRATDEGRLLAFEFDDRLGQALSARTYRELDVIVADLPRDRDLVKRPVRAAALLRWRPRRPALIATTAGALATVAAAAALMGNYVGVKANAWIRRPGAAVGG